MLSSRLRWNDFVKPNAQCHSCLSFDTAKEDRMLSSHLFFEAIAIAYTCFYLFAIMPNLLA